MKNVDAPEDGRPEDGRPEDGRPEDGRPEDGRPEDGRPEDGAPEDGEPLPEIASLSPESPPPAALEHEVLRRLRDEGLLASSRTRSRGLLAAAVLAGLAVGLAGGLYLGGRTDQERSSERARAPLFALFLWQGDSYRPAPESAVAARVERYSRWAAELREEGRTASGAKLADEARFVLPAAAQPTSTSPAIGQPSPSSLGELSGYFVIEAADVEEARRIAATCPHLEYGGAIEVRRIEG